MRRDVGRGALVSSTLVLGLSVAVLATTAIISFEPHEEEPAGTDEHEEEGEAGGVLGSMLRLSDPHGPAV